MRPTLLASLAMLGASQMAVAQTPDTEPASADASAPAPETAPETGAAWKYNPLADGVLGWRAQGAPGKKEGQIRSLRFMYFAEPKMFDRKRVHWIYDEFVIDCRANTFEILRGQLLDKNANRIGKSNASSDATPIADKSAEFILKKIYCDGVPFSTAKDAPSLDAAMEQIAGVKPKG